MKKLILAGLAVLATSGAIATSASAKNICDTVRCMSCPPGYHLKLTPPDCCTCLPN